MKKTQRMINADVIRLVAMLMIIVMHTFLSFTLRPDFFQTPIYYLLEPIVAMSNTGVLLFFMLSGYLVVGKKRTIPQNLHQTLVKLGIPLVFFSAINALISWQQMQVANLGVDVFLADLLKQILKFPNSSLWFLIVLMALYALNPIWELIFSSPDNKHRARYLLKLAFGFTFLITLAEYITGNNPVASPIFNNFTAWTGYAAFYLYGAAVKRGWVKINLQQINLALIVIGLCLTVGSDYFSQLLAKNGASYFWVDYNRSTTSPAVAMLAIGLFNQMLSINLEKFRSRLIVYLSQLSFGVYLIHTNVVALLTTYLGFDFDHLQMNIYVYNLVNLCLVLSVSFFLSAIIARIKGLRLIIGAGS